MPMYNSEQILTWLERNVQPMRQSRRKTLAAIVAAALLMKGVGVLALGRAMAGKVVAKHCIKRVWRFFRNPSLECEAISRALLVTLAPHQGPIVVLCDWTDLGPFKKLVVSLPRDGRSLPFMSITIAKDAGEGAVRRAEEEMVARLARIVPEGRRLVMVADRGFGNTRWLRSLQNRGCGFVQRLTGTLHVEVAEHIGALWEMGIVPGSPSKDWGHGVITEEHPLRVRLVTVYDEEAKEAWYLATSEEVLSAEVVRLYQRRMWIEESFRDLKNRNWGLGLDEVRLSEPARHDRLFMALSVAYAMLCAFGAAAETLEVDRYLKANTRKERVISAGQLLSAADDL